MNQNTVFLFGAGAVIDWDGPKTCDLTEVILESGFKTKDQEKTNTQFIKDCLLKTIDEDKINFETIIDVLEELFLFYGNNQNAINLSATFFKSNFDEDDIFFNYEDAHNYPFNIINPEPKLTKQQIYLTKLIRYLLLEINKAISNYSYHTNRHSKISSSKNKDSNILFSNWIKKKARTSLRLYTLNYDNLFKVLLENEGFDFFDGFNKIKNNTSEVSLPDFHKLLTDFNSNIYYNLHGSAYWYISYSDTNYGPYSPRIIKKNGIGIQTDPRITTVTVESGKPLLLNNIITGYKKSQKTEFPLFKQMNSAFDRDVITTNILYIIGYSFGDEHINLSIKTALRENPKLKIEIICYKYFENRLDKKLDNEFFKYLDNNSFNPKTIKDNVYSYFNGQIIVHDMKFKKYLENYSNK